MWNLISNNFYCNEKEILRTSQIHLEKLLNIRANIDNKGPETPFFLRNKLHLKQNLKEKKRKIVIGNNIIYRRLSSVKNICSPYSKSRNFPKYCPAFDKMKFNFNRKEKQRIISSENSSFYKRFSQNRSFYPFLSFMKKSEYEEYIRHNISKTKFLPKVSLKLCTFKEFKQHFMREYPMLNEKDNSLYHNNINKSLLSDNAKAVSDNKTNNKKIRLNNTFNKEINENNQLFIDDMKKRNSRYNINNLKRCLSVKNRSSSDISIKYL